jgi:hypothetical protein
VGCTPDPVVLCQAANETSIGAVGSRTGAFVGRILDVFLRSRVVGVAHACARSVTLDRRRPAFCCSGVGAVALGTGRRDSACGRRIVSWSGLCDLVAAWVACRQPRADNRRFQRTACSVRDSFSDASAGRDDLMPARFENEKEKSENLSKTTDKLASAIVAADRDQECIKGILLKAAEKNREKKSRESS